jgi:hypothetical protein
MSSTPGPSAEPIGTAGPPSDDTPTFAPYDAAAEPFSATLCSRNACAAARNQMRGDATEIRRHGLNGGRPILKPDTLP